MSGDVWTVERDDDGGIVHFETYKDDSTYTFGTELEAVEYGIDCVQASIEALRSSLRTFRQRERYLRRARK